MSRRRSNTLRVHSVVLVVLAVMWVAHAFTTSNWVSIAWSALVSIAAAYVSYCAYNEGRETP